MRRNFLGVVLCALVTACTIATSVAPARASQASVNACGSTIAKESTKMLGFFDKGFLQCYAARHKCAAAVDQDSCLAATEAVGKPCSCGALDVYNPVTSKVGKKLIKAEEKIGKKCNADILGSCLGGANAGAPCSVDSECPGGSCDDAPPITLDELLYEDPDTCHGGSNNGALCFDDSECPGGNCRNNPRRQLGYAVSRNCMCGTMVGDFNGSIGSYAEVIACIRLLLIKAAANNVGWDTDPRAQGEIFDLIAACSISIVGEPCIPRCAGGSNDGAVCSVASECPGGVCPN